MLQIYNTLTRTREEFKPIEEGKVRFYHCGPTVYWTQHIGNMRAMVLADFIHRSLEYLGYEVKFVRNYTDVGHLTDDGDEGEDKMSEGAKREKKTPQEIANMYIEQFEADTAALNIIDPDTKPRATEYVEQMINMVQDLLDNGFAYITPKAIYFDVSKFPSYTRLSGRDLDQNRMGAGKAEVSDSDKRNPEDFSIWFFKTGKHKDALQFWESPFDSPEVENGEGFPGWHIECSAMAISDLGNTIDIHMGGIEHISVHHPNEIAQSEGATGEKFVNYWLHNEHLTVDGEKMSKSEGTAYSVSELADKGYDPIALRYFFMQAHYRSKQNFTWEALDAASTALGRLRERVTELSEVGKGDIDLNYKEKFIAALEDDFNVPQALAVSWDMLKSDITNEDKKATILDFDQVLGLKLDESEDTVIPEEAKKLLDERAEARDGKNWELSDKLRNQLKEEFGLLVEDGEEGQRVKNE